jgi:hypothetical protein
MKIYFSMLLSALCLASHPFLVAQIRGEQRRSPLPAPAAGEDFQGERDSTISLASLRRGARGRSEEGDIMLWLIGGGLLLLWLVGFAGHVGGAFIHLFLVAAMIVFAWHYVTGRRTI